MVSGTIKNFLLVIGSTQISVKRLRSAGESSLLPKSPLGFMVAIMANLA